MPLDRKKYVNLTGDADLLANLATRHEFGLRPGHPGNGIFGHPPELIAIGTDIKVRAAHALNPGDRIRCLPWFAISATRHRLHPGRAVLDCTHLAYTPFLYDLLVDTLHLHLDDLL